MRITNEVLTIIGRAVSSLTYETGGILGSSDGIIVDKVSLDSHEIQSSWKCAYIPNIAYLNQIIDGWCNRDITFMGMFHTHFMGINTLSCGDMEYIRTVMDAMPEEITRLYFPVFALPNQELTCYQATKMHGTITIELDDLSIEP